MMETETMSDDLKLPTDPHPLQGRRVVWHDPVTASNPSLGSWSPHGQRGTIDTVRSARSGVSITIRWDKKTTAVTTFKEPFGPIRFITDRT